MESEGNFDVHHHERNRISFDAKMSWWADEVSRGFRCGKCWLRIYDCFCPDLDAIGSSITNMAGNRKATVCMYYHYQEIGRSANTGHLFEALCPSICSPLVFGDASSELSLIDEIAAEFDANEAVTCILYPTNSALLLSEWIAKRPAASKDKPIRIVALDGTYAQASRQWKYMTRCLQLRHGRELPVVKLDLAEGMCRSAIVGIMSQPGKEKICTFQAVVMAMQQAGENEEACQMLFKSLDVWLMNMLKAKIKLGKRNIRVLPDVQFTPSNEIQEYLDKNPPPVNRPENSKKREKTYKFFLKRASALEELRVKSSLRNWIGENPKLRHTSMHSKIHLVATRVFAVHSLSPSPLAPAPALE